MEIEEITGEKYFREIRINKNQINSEKRTIDLSFSSEEPVDRFFGAEILDHSKGAVLLDRLNNSANLLMNHDPDNVVGVVEQAEVGKDRKGRAVVRFGRSAFADEIFQDVLDGIRRNVSVGYRLHKVEEEKITEGVSIFRVTEWEPFEISIVGVPADPTVGVNRSLTKKSEVKKMNPVAEVKQEVGQEKVAPAANIEIVSEPKVNEQEVRAGIQATELARVKEIAALGAKYDISKKAEEYIRSDKSIEDFQRAILEGVVQSPENIVKEDPANLDMSDKDVKNFSMIRAFNHMSDPGKFKAGLELEASRAVEEKIGKKPQGMFFPNDVLKRALTVGAPTAGGNTVATNLLGGSFIEILRNQMVMRQLGATILSGLAGNVAIPRQSGGGTAYWVAENTAPTEGEPTFDQVTLSPNVVGAFTDISRSLRLQTSVDIEGIVRRDLATVLALGIDLAAINGTGAGSQPLGILNTTGIGDVNLGLNGGAPTWGNMVELETDVANANALLGSLSYLTNANVVGKLKQTPKVAQQPQYLMSDNGQVNGYNVARTNQVPNNLAKGTGSNLSAMIFGNWSDLIIGEWGALDMLADPYTGSASGALRIRVLMEVDIAVRHAASFSAAKGMITV